MAETIDALVAITLCAVRVRCAGAVGLLGILEIRIEARADGLEPAVAEYRDERRRMELVSVRCLHRIGLIDQVELRYRRAIGLFSLHPLRSKHGLDVENIPMNRVVNDQVREVFRKRLREHVRIHIEASPNRSIFYPVTSVQGKVYDRRMGRHRRNQTCRSRSANPRRTDAKSSR